MGSGTLGGSAFGSSSAAAFGATGNSIFGLSSSAMTTVNSQSQGSLFSSSTSLPGTQGSATSVFATSTHSQSIPFGSSAVEREYIFFFREFNSHLVQGQMLLVLAPSLGLAPLLPLQQPTLVALTVGQHLFCLGLPIGRTTSLHSVPHSIHRLALPLEYPVVLFRLLIVPPCLDHPLLLLLQLLALSCLDHSLLQFLQLLAHPCLDHPLLLLLQVLVHPYLDQPLLLFLPLLAHPFLDLPLLLLPLPHTHVWPTTSAPMFGSSLNASSSSIFSFTSAATPTSTQPVFGNPNPVFSFGSAPNNEHMSMEDSMAEDPVQSSTPLTPATLAVGQQPAPPQSNSVFGAPAPSGARPFQFGTQQNIAPQSPSPFQASGSLEFNVAGSFSLGTGGGDQSGRKYVKVNKNKAHKK